MVAQISLQAGAQPLGDIVLAPSNPQGDKPGVPHTWEWPYVPPHGMEYAGRWRWIRNREAPNPNTGQYAIQLMIYDDDNSPILLAVLHSRYWTIGGDAPFGPWFSHEDRRAIPNFSGAWSGIGTYWLPVEMRPGVLPREKPWPDPLTGKVDFWWTTGSVLKPMNPFDGSDPPKGGSVGDPGKLNYLPFPRPPAKR